MSGLLLIGLTTLALRAAASFALQSERAYLVAPALVTIVMGLAYVASAATTKPLLSLVISDLVPPSWVDTDAPRTARLCRIASVVWGGEQIVSAAVSLAMILRVSATTYMMLHQLVSWLIVAVVLGAVVPFFWPDLRVLWRAHRPASAQPGLPVLRKGGPGVGRRGCDWRCHGPNRDQRRLSPPLPQPRSGPPTWPRQSSW